MRASAPGPRDHPHQRLRRRTPRRQAPPAYTWVHNPTSRRAGPRARVRTRGRKRGAHGVSGTGFGGALPRTTDRRLPRPPQPERHCAGPLPRVVPVEQTRPPAAAAALQAPPGRLAAPRSSARPAAGTGAHVPRGAARSGFAGPRRGRAYHPRQTQSHPIAALSPPPECRGRHQPAGVASVRAAAAHRHATCRAAAEPHSGMVGSNSARRPGRSMKSSATMTTKHALTPAMRAGCR